MRLFQIIVFIFLFNLLNADEIKPSYQLKGSGAITDMVYKNGLLYTSTAASKVDIFDIEKRVLKSSITLPKIKDFMGDIIDSKIYSVDVLEDSILMVSQGAKGGRFINIYKDDKLNEIISDKKRWFIAKAKFLNKNKIVFALLSNQIYLYDLKNKKILKEIQVSQSKFSDFVLDEKKENLLVADESGELKLLDINTLEIKEIFEGLNVDNIFQVDLKNGLIISAGQDRRSAIYSLDKFKSYYKKASFLIYSAALSPSAKLGAYAHNENNDIIVFNTDNKKELYTLVQNPATITKTLFINENELFISSDFKEINYYKLKD